MQILPSKVKENTAYYVQPIKGRPASATWIMQFNSYTDVEL